MKEGAMNESSMKESEHIASEKPKPNLSFDFYPPKTDWDPLGMKKQTPTKSVNRGVKKSSASLRIRRSKKRGGRHSRRNKHKSRKNRC